MKDLTHKSKAIRSWTCILYICLQIVIIYKQSAHPEARFYNIFTEFHPLPEILDHLEVGTSLVLSLNQGDELHGQVDHPLCQVIHYCQTHGKL